MLFSSKIAVAALSVAGLTLLFTVLLELCKWWWQGKKSAEILKKRLDDQDKVLENIEQHTNTLEQSQTQTHTDLLKLLKALTEAQTRAQTQIETQVETQIETQKDIE